MNPFPEEAHDAIIKLGPISQVKTQHDLGTIFRIQEADSVY